MKSFLKKILLLFKLTPDDIKWYFSYRDHIDESYLVNQFFKNIKNRTMIDVGFAWGQASIPFLNREWKVYGFEPDRSPTKTIAIDNALKAFPNLTMDKRAVSDASEKELTFYTSAESEGISSLHSFKSHEPSHSVKTITLDDFITTNRISEIDFLKIDTEGHDLFVLNGLSFDKVAPKIVLAEFDDYKTLPLNYTHQDLGNLFLSHGYSVYLFEWHPIEKYGSTHKFRRFYSFPTQLKNPDAWGNFIAIHPTITKKFEGFITSSRYKKYYDA